MARPPVPNYQFSLLGGLIVLASACSSGSSNDPDTNPSPTANSSNLTTNTTSNPTSASGSATASSNTAAIGELDTTALDAIKGTQQVLLRLSAADASSETLNRPATKYNVSIVDRKPATQGGMIRKTRGATSMSDQLVVVAFSKRLNKELAQVTVANPRFSFTETVNENSELSGSVRYPKSASVWLEIPNNPNIDQLKVLEPRWNGQAYTLALVGVSDL